MQRGEDFCALQIEGKKHDKDNVVSGKETWMASRDKDTEGKQVSTCGKAKKISYDINSKKKMFSKVKNILNFQKSEQN